MKKSFINIDDVGLTKIVREGKKDSSQAFEALYDRYANNVFTYCSKVLASNPLLVKDVFQDTFSKFYEVLKNGKNEILSVNAYLIRIARNLCLNEMGRRSFNTISIDKIDISFNDNSSESKELSEIINLAIDTLPDEFKEVIVMKELMDMSYPEIAEALDIEQSLIRVRVYRAKQKLRKILEPYLKDFYYTDNKILG
ncbi:MAG TPA: sigma-70 family RNA polymerase sigma factor [Candidatus Kapabacteria bacterium]|nr:sigma-70 family RNA polymerase sigma factor [Candidatus Kapabacteria bacterium]